MNGGEQMVPTPWSRPWSSRERWRNVPHKAWIKWRRGASTHRRFHYDPGGSDPSKTICWRFLSVLWKGPYIFRDLLNRKFWKKLENSDLSDIPRSSNESSVPEWKSYTSRAMLKIRFKFWRVPDTATETPFQESSRDSDFQRIPIPTFWDFKREEFLCVLKRFPLQQKECGFNI